MKINRKDSASVSLLCSHASRAQSLGWTFPAWRALVEACFSHLCDCASAFLICPQVPSSSHHEQAPSSESQPTHLDPWNSDLFCFKSLPPGAATDWECDLQTYRTPTTTKPLTWLNHCLYFKTLAVVSDPSGHLATIMLLLGKEDGSCSNKATIQCMPGDNRYFSFFTPVSHKTQAGICQSDRL